MIRAPLKAVRARIGDMDNRDELTKQYFNGANIVISGRMQAARLGDLGIDRDGVPLLLVQGTFRVSSIVCGNSQLTAHT